MILSTNVSAKIYLIVVVYKDKEKSLFFYKDKNRSPYKEKVLWSVCTFYLVTREIVFHKDEKEDNFFLLLQNQRINLPVKRLDKRGLEQWQMFMRS